MALYTATATQVRTEVKANNTTETPDSALLPTINWITERLMSEKGCEFEPTIYTKRYDAWSAAGTPEHISQDGRTLYLRAPLLSATTITLGDSTVVTTDQYTYGFLDNTPYFALILKRSSGLVWTQYTTDWEKAISIAGVWGYRRSYTNAWVTGSTLNGAISDTTGTTVTVTSSTLFSAGHLIRVDSEYMRVTAVSGNNLTVERGVNGSTAATHLTSTIVYIFEWEGVVNRATLRWAAYLFQRKGSFETASFDGVASVQYPADMPGEVQGILGTFYNSGGFMSGG